MKLHITPTENLHTITAYSSKGIEINGVWLTESFIVMPYLAPIHWPICTIDTLTVEHLQYMTHYHPQVILLGTGPTQHFISPVLSRFLTEQHIGVECMATEAACRTYNILASEGRKVALGAIIYPL